MTQRPDTLDENNDIRAVLHRDQWSYHTGTHGLEPQPGHWQSTMEFRRGRERLVVTLVKRVDAR